MTLAAEETPEGISLRPRPTGIIRLNNLPLYMVGAVGLLIVIMLAYTMHERSKAITLEGENGEVRRTADTTAPNKLTGPYTGTEIAAPVDAIPQAPQTPLQASAEQPPTPAPPRHYNPSLMEQERERQAQKRLQMRYGAFEAPTEVSFMRELDGGAGTKAAPTDPRQALYQAALAQAGMRPGGSAGSGSTDGDPNNQADKNAFFDREIPKTQLINGRDRALSQFLIRSGTVIPASMISGLNSDLPGEIIAQVSQNVYDTASGRYLIIPQGTRLVGTYYSHVSYGQDRALVVWKRLVFPDASALELGTMPGNDMAGYAGFNDQVDHHYFRIFGSALLMSVIGAGYAIASEDSSKSQNETNAQSAIAQGMSQTSDRLLRKNLNLQPTIKVRPGYRFNVFVNKDIQFRTPYLLSQEG
jgi:type IV secretory pathway VirB10-like protein